MNSRGRCLVNLVKTGEQHQRMNEENDYHLGKCNFFVNLRI